MSDAIDESMDGEFEATHRTIKLTESELRAAARVLEVIVGLAGDRGRELTKLAGANVPASCNPVRELLVEYARQTFVQRARRSQNFHPAMFGEPAWDMMLALYVTEQSQARHTVSGLVNLSGVPPTTALRWLDFLEKEELVARRSSPTDRRVIYIELTDKARESLDAFFAGTVPAEAGAGQAMLIARE
jgi:DNA-binding MarR family transcriptional regulator